MGEGGIGSSGPAGGGGDHPCTVNAKRSLWAGWRIEPRTRHSSLSRPLALALA